MNELSTVGPIPAMLGTCWLSDDSQVQDLSGGFRRNVQKFNSYITQNGFTAARRAAMTSWRPCKTTCRPKLIVWGLWPPWNFRRLKICLELR